MIMQPTPPGVPPRGVRRCHVGLVVSDLTVTDYLGRKRFRLRCVCGVYLDADERNVLEDAALSCGNHPPADGRAPGAYGLAHRNVRRERGNPGACSCGRPAAEWAFNDECQPDGYTTGGYPYSLDPAAYVPVCIRCHRRAAHRAHRARGAEALF